MAVPSYSCSHSHPVLPPIFVQTETDSLDAWLCRLCNRSEGLIRVQGLLELTKLPDEGNADEGKSDKVGVTGSEVV